MYKVKEIPTDSIFIERFKNKINKINKSEGCWEWLGCKSTTGYGVTSFKRKRYFAHRVSYFIYYKKIDTTLVVDHKCSNKICVNPHHLQLVTRSENVLLGYDREHEGRSRKLRFTTSLPSMLLKGNCCKGHPIQSSKDYNHTVTRYKGTVRNLYACKKCESIRRKGVYDQKGKRICYTK